MSEAATGLRRSKRKRREREQEPPPQDDPKAEMRRALHEAAAAAPHLAYYLRSLDLEALGGEPDFYEKADRKAGDVPFKNFIYAVGKGLFVHIISDPEDARDTYASIEPSLGESDLGWISARIDTYLLDYVDELEGCEDEDQKADVLLHAVDDHVKVHGHRRGSGGGGSKSFLSFGRKKKSDGGEHEELVVTPEELSALKYIVLREKIGLGPLQPLIQDPNIEDISCSGIGAVFIEHKQFGGLKSNIRFDETEQLDDFVLRLSEKIKKPVTYKNPISDATLPDGSRINIVYGNDVSTRGSNFTIRKFTAVPLSILDIIASGGISSEMAAYLSMIIGEGLNLFVSGETASGKTTLLNALTAFYVPSGKIVTIEDTPELQVPHANWTREVVRGSMSAADSGVTMFSLLRAALRQRPNAILVGEIRGEEGAIAFQAMQTGHAVAATFHASSVEKLIQRLTGAPISVPKAYIDNLNVVCIASAVRLPNGRPGRRILSINELIGYDSAADAFSFIEVYRWVPHNDTFEATGHMNSYLLENRVAPARGIDPQNKRAIYDEMMKRARLFERLLEAGRTNFFDLYKAFAQAQRQGII